MPILRFWATLSLAILFPFVFCAEDCNIVQNCTECNWRADCKWCLDPDVIENKCFNPAGKIKCTNTYENVQKFTITRAEELSKGKDGKKIKLTPQEAELKLGIGESPTGCGCFLFAFFSSTVCSAKK